MNPNVADPSSSCAPKTHPLIRLEDYRPSDWLIDTVDLDISLHPDEDAQCARSSSCGPTRPAARVRRSKLDGDELKLVALRLDGPLDRRSRLQRESASS